MNGTSLETINIIIFLLVLILLYSTSALFSRKNVLHRLIEEWLWAIGFPILLAFEFFQDNIQKLKVEWTGFIALIIPLIFIGVGVAIAITKNNLKKIPPGGTLFTWQPVTVAGAYLISFLVGLISVKMGYLLLVLSFTGSIIIYQFFPDRDR